VAVAAPSTLSMAANLVRNRLLTKMLDDSSTIDVTIDTPAAASKAFQPATGKSLLNLFFYRIEPSGFYDAAGAGERWYIRIFCLMTVFSTDETDNGTTIPQGEVDLRILGEVLRYFHENPVLDAGSEVGAKLEIVLNALSSQEINQIWSTQGDVPYRPSLLYEFALLPIEPKTFATPPLPVAAGGAHVDTFAKLDPVPPKKPAIWESPVVETGLGTEWAPALSFVVTGKATQSVMLKHAANLKAPLWLAGPKTEAVDLVWQKIGTKGVWETISGATKTGVAIPAQPVPPGNGVIDPAQAGTAGLVLIDVAVPELGVPAADKPNYLLLTAQRMSGTTVLAVSNPLIVSIVKGP